jgi:hypothetical protein
VAPGQELADHLPDDRRPAHAAAHNHAKAGFPVGALQRVQPDVVRESRGPVRHRTVHRDLELARQESEFRVQGRPLPDELAPDQRVDDLVLRHTRKMVRRGIADAVTRGLDGVHLDLGEFGKDVGYPLECGPVELDVLPRGEMAVAAIVLARDVRELAQLAGRQQPVGNGHAQHWRVALDIEPILQSQRAELLFAQLTGKKARRLIAKLEDPFVHQPLVDFVVEIHAHARVFGLRMVRATT